MLSCPDNVTNSSNCSKDCDVHFVHVVAWIWYFMFIMVLCVVLTCIQLSRKLRKGRISATIPDRVMLETLE